MPGFIAFHSNRSEDLAEVVISWIRRHPLNPLEEEIILVQSNGMAEWVKMELARMGGVCAATRVELPSRFLWRTYRQILGREAVPSDSPYLHSFQYPVSIPFISPLDSPDGE